LHYDIQIDPDSEVSWHCMACGTPSRSDAAPHIIVAEFTDRCGNEGCRRVVNMPPTTRQDILQLTYVACGRKPCRKEATDRLRNDAYGKIPETMGKCPHCANPIRTGVRISEATAKSRIKVYLETHNIVLADNTAPPAKRSQRKPRVAVNATKNNEQGC
jgi:hypothetical protein